CAPMSEASTSDACFIRGCGAPVSGCGGRIPQPLCQKHLDQDRQKVRELQRSVQNKLAPMKAKRDQLRTYQQTLAAELQAADDLLDEAFDLLTKWRTSVTTRLTERHDGALENLTEFSVLQEYDSAVDAAESANDLRKVFELSSEMELKCTDLEDKLEEADAEETAEGIDDARRIVGDVSGSLRDLLLLVDRQMREVVQRCEVANTTVIEKEICELHSEILELDGKPQWVAACTNTEGFTSDSAGRLVKVGSSSGSGAEVPAKCVFVMFHVDSKKDHILLCSLDGSVRLTVNCDIDWSIRSIGIHCDSKRQALFLGQPDRVTVADLNGYIRNVIKSSDSDYKFLAIGGCSEKIYLLEQKSISILCWSKSDTRFISKINLAGMYSECAGVIYEGLSPLGNSILVTDWNANHVLKICTISGRLIATYELPTPADVVAHQSGLIFVSQSIKNLVRVFKQDGEVLQTVGMPDDSTAMADPYGLDVLDADVPMLAICQKGGNAVSIFKVNAPSLN
ncbi:hypothetical protein BOX15_Mlig022866g7, partial [Macrostomum lignano]